MRKLRMDFEDYYNRPFAKKYKLKDLTPSNIDKLIKDKLFNESDPSMSSDAEDSTCFEPIMYINSLYYRISDTVLKEIYNTLRFLIEELNPIDYWDMNYIEANIDARFTINEKIEYLKEKRKELYVSIQDQPEYYVYLGTRDFNGFDNWEDYIFETLLYREETVIKYLTNDIQMPDIPDDIYNEWLKYYQTAEVIHILENKINKLSLTKTEDSVKKIDLSFQLALLEQIMKIENWDDISANKKGIILTNLLGKNKDNIKDYYIESTKKHTDVNSKFYDKLGKYETDKIKASNLLKEILG